MSSTSPGAPPAGGPGKTALTNVRVFDGQQLRAPATVVIEGDRIGADPAGAAVVDGNGGALLPGLIDAHVHVRDRGTLERLASFGVTTVLDMASPSPAQVDSLRAVPGLTGLRSAGLPALAPGSLHARLLVTDQRAQIKGADQAGQFVADRVAEGSDYIKIVVGSPGADHDQATVDALVAAAHEHGKQAVAHASSYAAVAKAQQAGVDVLTHAPLDQALDEVSVTRMATGGRILIPTLTMMQTLVSRLGLPDASYAAARASVAAAYRAGVPILAGTDANADAGSPAPVSHGDSLHHELELLVDAGLTSLDALRAATVLPARCFGLADRGVVEPGRRADLVLVDGDPLRDIRATRSLRLVWCGGIVHGPAEPAG
jgi:imidazolonepropionase-like amidohydrolase